MRNNINVTVHKRCDCPYQNLAENQCHVCRGWFCARYTVLRSTEGYCCSRDANDHSGRQVIPDIVVLISVMGTVSGICSEPSLERKLYAALGSVSSPNALAEKPASTTLSQQDPVQSRQHRTATKSEVQSTEPTATKTAKCTFSGEVLIDLRRFRDSGIALVECPDCGRAWTLSPHGGKLRFKAHDKRKTQSQTTSRWWVQRETGWEVVSN